MRKRFFVTALALVLALAMTTTVFAETPNAKTACQKNATSTTKTPTSHNHRVYAGKWYKVNVLRKSNDTYLYYTPKTTGYIRVSVSLDM